MKGINPILLISVAAFVVIIIGVGGYFLFSEDSAPMIERRAPQANTSGREPLKPPVPTPDELEQRRREKEARESAGNLSGGTNDTPTRNDNSRNGAAANRNLSPEDQPWFTMTSGKLGYRVSFPAEPESLGNSASDNGEGYQATRDETQYSFTASPSPVADLTANEQLADLVKTTRESFADFQVEAENEINLGGHPGHMLTVVDEDAKTRRLIRLVAVNNHAYTLSVEGDNSLAETDSYVADFLDSLTLADIAANTTANSDEGDGATWHQINGSNGPFRVSFPTDVIHADDVLTEVRNRTTQGQFAQKWNQDQALCETHFAEVAGVAYVATVFVDRRRTVSRAVNPGEQRAMGLLRAIYGGDVVKEADQSPLKGPELAGATVLKDLLILKSQTTVIVRIAQQGDQTFLLRVEKQGPGLSITNARVVKFLTGISSDAAAAPIQSTEKNAYRNAIVRRYLPLAGTEFETEDGEIITVKMTSQTNYLDTSGERVPRVTPEKIRDLLLKVGNRVIITLDPAAAPNQQQTVQQVRVLAWADAE